MDSLTAKERRTILAKVRFRTIGTRRADQGVRLRPLVWALVMVSGFIFFCYNDYRTHIRDKGTGVMKPRIHGVVDLFKRTETFL